MSEHEDQDDCGQYAHDEDEDDQDEDGQESYKIVEIYKEIGVYLDLRVSC